MRPSEGLPRRSSRTVHSSWTNASTNHGGSGGSGGCGGGSGESGGLGSLKINNHSPGSLWDP